MQPLASSRIVDLIKCQDLISASVTAEFIFQKVACASRGLNGCDDGSERQTYAFYSFCSFLI
jgi:hypothetical protein